MNTKEFQIPSGPVIVIRENNGDDEGILSSMTDAADGTNLLKYLAAIIEKGIDGKKPLAADFNRWKTNDLYYIAFLQRVFNLGNEFQFKFECTSCEKESEYDEDLNEWLAENFKINEPIINNAPKPYPFGSDEIVNFTIATGRKFRFKPLTYEMENKPILNRNTNTSLLQRELEEELTPGQWQRVTFFKNFNSKEMAQLRGAINKLDEQWQPLTSMVCPHCKTKNKTNIFFLPGFYYPEETTLI